MFIPALTYLPSSIPPGSSPAVALAVLLVLLFIIVLFRLLMLSLSGINGRYSGGLFSPEQIEPDFPFVTDGCSGGMTILWNKIFGKDPPWNDLCEQHDKHYWRGGTRKQRYAADWELRAGVASRGYPVWAFLIFWGVRVGGVPWLPTSWRWAYGWKFPRDYEIAYRG